MSSTDLRIAACVIVKNEGDAILEWGLYHHLIGFDSLLIFDDASTDHTLAEIEKLRKYCHVVVEPFEKELGNDQVRVYRRTCHLYRDDYDWIAFIDADEFIFSPHSGHDNPNQSGNFKEFLAAHSGAAAVALPWLIFGSSGHKNKPCDLVLSSYTSRAQFNQFAPQKHVKSLIRPEKLVRCSNPHAFEVDGITIGPNGKEIVWQRPGILKDYDQYQSWRINHYFTKSEQNWAERIARGQLGGEKSKRTLEDFRRYDRNDVEDLSALPYAESVRSLINEKSNTATSDSASQAPGMKSTQPDDAA